MSKISKYTPLVVTLVGTASLFLAAPQWVSGHPTATIILSAVAQILHAALPSVFGTSQS